MTVDKLFQSKKKREAVIDEFTKVEREEDPLIQYWMKRKRKKEKEPNQKLC